MEDKRLQTAAESPKGWEVVESADDGIDVMVPVGVLKGECNTDVGERSGIEG